jgi:lysophospholipid acyltransferase
LHIQKDLSEDQKPHLVRKFPNVLDFLGFIFFYPAFLVGPSFDFSAYQSFIRDEAPYKTITVTAPNGNRTRTISGDINSNSSSSSSSTDDSQQKSAEAKEEKVIKISPPFAGRLYKTVECLTVAMLMLAIYMTLLPHFNYEFTLEDGYMKWPLWRRFLHLPLAGLVQRASFYLAWKLSEGACVLSGFAYNGCDPRSGLHRWDRCENVRIMHIELAENARMFLG